MVQFGKECIAQFDADNLEAERKKQKRLKIKKQRKHVLKFNDSRQISGLFGKNSESNYELNSLWNL